MSVLPQLSVRLSAAGPLNVLSEVRLAHERAAALLQDETLFLVRDAQAALPTLRGEVNLLGAFLYNGGPNDIFLQTASGRRYDIYAASPDEAADWRAALLKALQLRFAVLLSPSFWRAPIRRSLISL